MFNFLIDNIKERLDGNKAKANARLGLVGEPEGTGKIIWIVAGDSYSDFIMAASLLAAIREKRQDIRLVLTYETEYQDLIVQYMSGAKKIGFGYHCGDNAMAAKQMIKRLSPFAVIFVGEEPKASFTKALAQYPEIHKIAFQFTPQNLSPSTNPSHDYSLFYEACYPVSMVNGTELKNNVPKPSVESSTESNVTFISKKFNVLTRIVQQQVDKQLGALLCKALDGKLFHLHNVSDDAIGAFLLSWKKQSGTGQYLNAQLLVLSFSNVVLNHSINNEAGKFTTIQTAIKNAGFNWVMLSQWDQNPIAENTIVIADEEKWYAAVCASSTATHLYFSDALHWWQSLASGAVISIDSKTDSADGFNSVVQTLVDSEQICFYWNKLLNAPLEQRKQSDATRKLFWVERRKAETQVNELLQRVYDW